MSRPATAAPVARRRLRDDRLRHCRRARVSGHGPHRGLQPAGLRHERVVARLRWLWRRCSSHLRPTWPAIKSANFFSGAPGPGEKARFTGLFARKTTTMRRTNRPKIRPLRSLSAHFLRAPIVEWLFPMHLGKTLPRLQRAVLLQTTKPNLAVLGLENAVAQQRCAATWSATINSNLEWQATSHATTFSPAPSADSDSRTQICRR